MDGFATISEAADAYAYTQYVPEDLPNYWHWAEEFVLGDNSCASGTRKPACSSPGAATPSRPRS